MKMKIFFFPFLFFFLCRKIRKNTLIKSNIGKVKKKSFESTQKSSYPRKKNIKPQNNISLIVSLRSTHLYSRSRFYAHILQCRHRHADFVLLADRAENIGHSWFCMHWYLYFKQDQSN